MEPLLDAIAEAVDAAEKDPAKDRSKYGRGSAYLIDQIEAARAKVTAEAEDPPKAMRLTSPRPTASLQRSRRPRNGPPRV